MAPYKGTNQVRESKMIIHVHQY